MRSYRGLRHTSTRDWRRCLQATGAGTFASAGINDLGQSFTISCMVYLAAYGTVMAIWNCAAGAGVRFTISTTGMLTLNNATDAAQVAAVPVPLRQWCKVECTFSGDTRAVEFRIDGEPIYTGTMAGTTAWTYTAVNAMTLQLGSRVARLQAWRRVLSREESRADFYSWSGPAADISYPLNNTTTSVLTVPGTVDGAPTTAAVTNVVWTDDVPSHPLRSPRPWGYSLLADYVSNNVQVTPIPPIPMLNTLRGKPGLTLGHWVRFEGAQSSSFGSLSLGLSNNQMGPRLRWDCTSVAGQIRLTLNGKTGAGTGTTIAPTTGDLRSLLQGRWVHAALVVDYAAKQVRAYLDGLPIALDAAATLLDANAGAGYTCADGFHPEPLDSTEHLYMGCLNAAGTMRTLQTDHIIVAAAATDAELRALALYGTAPAATVWRCLWPEGVGQLSTESVTGTVCTLTRGGTPNSTLWRPDAP